jgi:hypothetical protein
VAGPRSGHNVTFTNLILFAMARQGAVAGVHPGAVAVARPGAVAAARQGAVAVGRQGAVAAAHQDDLLVCTLGLHS